MNSRLTKLEHALEEKDRELREVSLHRAEIIQQLDIIQDVLKASELLPKTGLSKIYKDEAIQTLDQFSTGDSPGDKKEKKGKVSKDAKGKAKIKGKDAVIKQVDFKDKLHMLEAFEGDKKDLSDFKSKYSYRERMILMNRIDIYRLFTTVMIISSEIKYPRVLTKIEERELRLFIEELNDFENLILDLNANDNLLWEKGKVCEKQILQLFSSFYNKKS